jgi:hypothetical protein
MIISPTNSNGKKV